MAIFLASFCVWERVSISIISSSVPKPPGKHDQRLRQIREPQLAHEEVVELEAQLGRDVRVGKLLERQADIQADGLASGIGRAAIGRFHNARPAAGADHEAVRAVLGELRGPLGDHAGQRARIAVILRQGPVVAHAGRAERTPPCRGSFRGGRPPAAPDIRPAGGWPAHPGCSEILVRGRPPAAAVRRLIVCHFRVARFVFSARARSSAVPAAWETR
jgi:hypothetical protein